jgi:hypothetical protein
MDPRHVADLLDPVPGPLEAIRETFELTWLANRSGRTEVADEVWSHRDDEHLGRWLSDNRRRIRAEIDAPDERRKGPS